MQTATKESGLPGPNLPGRILVIAPQPFYEDRGTPIAVRRVIEALIERGNQVDLLTYPVGETIDLPGLRIFRVGIRFRIRHVPIGFSIRKLFLDALLIPAIIKRLQQENYSCIHAVEEAAFPAVVAGRKYKVPVIYDMQSSLPEQLTKHRIFRSAIIQRGFCFLERWLIRKSDFIVCSVGLEEYVRTVDPSARVAAWHFPGIHVDVSAEEIARLREELEITPDSLVVLYTGNFASYQGVARLIDAVPQVLDHVPNTVFVLVGADSPDDFALAKRIVNWDKRKALRLLARQPQTLIPRYLAMADVIVSPREYGGNLPLKIFDYMAAGKPIVATDCPTHRMVLNDDQAVLVGPTAEEFAKAIVRLFQDRALGKRLGMAAHAYAQERLGWNAFIQLVTQIYDQSKGRKSRQRGWVAK